MIKIENGRLIDPANNIDTVTDLYIDKHIIAAIGAAPDNADVTQRIDATNKIVCPGLIDLSAHLREPGFTHKATIASETHAAAAAGITTLICPPTTQPVC